MNMDDTAHRIQRMCGKTKKEISDELGLKTHQTKYICKKYGIDTKSGNSGKKFGSFDKKPRKQRMTLKTIVEDIGNGCDLPTDHFQNRSGPVIEKVSDIDTRVPYCGEMVKKFSDHIGQRKLFMNELQFLTKSRGKAKYFIYAGSAPGHKTHFLSSLFPDIKFILIDPNKHDLRVNGKSHRDGPHRDIVHLSLGYPTRSNVDNPDDISDYIMNSSYKIFILEEYMTDELAKTLAPLDSIFASDIRSNVYNAKYPSDYDIYWNYAMMFNWLNIMRPVSSMLKFRIPYFSDDKPFQENVEFETSKTFGIDFYEDYTNQRLRLPSCELYIQPWAPQSSTEVRAFIEDRDLGNIVDIDITDIEERMFYYNSVNRSWFFHDNPNSNKKINFCHCNDCALENMIWTEYGLSGDKVHTMVTHLGMITSRPLHKSHRYPVFSVLTLPQMDATVRQWQSTNKRKFARAKGNTGKKIKNIKGGANNEIYSIEYIEKLIQGGRDKTQHVKNLYPNRLAAE